MKGYKFYSKSDSSKEAIAVWNTNSFASAVEGFAKIKNLPVSKFLEIYEVEEYDRP